MEIKPKVQLTGNDGNAFIVMGLCAKAAKKAGWDKDKVDRVLEEMQDGDYNNLIHTATKYFDVG